MTGHRAQLQAGRAHCLPLCKPGGRLGPPRTRQGHPPPFSPHLYGLGNLHPLSDGHIAGVKQALALQDRVDDPLAGAGWAAGGTVLGLRTGPRLPAVMPGAPRPVHSPHTHGSSRVSSGRPQAWACSASWNMGMVFRTAARSRPGTSTVDSGHRLRTAVQPAPEMRGP